MGLAAKLLQRIQLHAERFDDGKWHWVVQSGFRGRAGYDGKYVIQDTPERIIALAERLEPLVAQGELVRFKYLTERNKPGHPHGTNPCMILFATREEREPILLTLQAYGYEPTKWIHDNLSGVEFEKKARQQRGRAEEDTFIGIVQRAAEQIQYALQNEYGAKRVLTSYRFHRSGPAAYATISVAVIINGRKHYDVLQFLVQGRSNPENDEVTRAPALELVAAAELVRERSIAALLAAKKTLEPLVALHIRRGLLSETSASAPTSRSTTRRKA